jgi:hypothetical protein
MARSGKRYSLYPEPYAHMKKRLGSALRYSLAMGLLLSGAYIAILLLTPRIPT